MDFLFSSLPVYLDCNFLEMEQSNDGVRETESAQPVGKKRRYTLGNLLYISSSRSVNVIPVELVLAMLVLSKRDCEKKGVIKWSQNAIS